MKIVFLFEGNFEIGGRDRHYKAGDVEEVSGADGHRLIAGLCAEEDKLKRKTKKEGDKWQDEQSQNMPAST